ncbi:MAG: TrkA family potassium uptake protein [Candidatus Eisenbacteria bacterium]|nr:TrkA family potassium uptake protein [Candidatus Eisenbacteria bacterium]
MKRIVVIGLGNFGAAVAETLYAGGQEVAALDADEKRVERIAPRVTLAAVGDGKDIKTLERIGAREADAAVVSMGDDIAESVLTALALRDIGVQEIYVKVVSDNHARVMEKIGVTETIFPEKESGMRLGRRVASRWLLNYVELTPGFSIQEMVVPLPWINRSLRQLELPKNYRVSVVAVHDVLTDRVSTIPDPDEPLRDSDTLLLAGKEADLAKIAEIK